MKKLFLYFVLLSGASGFAQGENDNWYFGQNAGLNFATNPPTSLPNSQINQFEGVASISRPNGQLLFYTDGITIWGANHLPMPNSGDLTGNVSTTQSALIVPHPGDSKLYYVFTMPAGFVGKRSYSIVDFSLNGGFGDVVANQKNIPLLDQNGNETPYSSEAITVAANSEGTGYWVLLPIGNTMYSYRITEDDGFVNMPTATTMTFYDTPVTGICHARVSPDNSKVAVTRFGTDSRFKVYNFDNSTGIIDNTAEIGINNTRLYTSEFSGNSEVVYVNQPEGLIFVLDLVNLQTRTINGNTNFGTMQRTKYNDILIAQTFFSSPIDASNSLARIKNVDDYANSSLEFNYAMLGNGLSLLGLPQWVPILPKSQCADNITLSAPGDHIFRLYHYNKRIITNDKYKVESGQKTTLKAGKSIELLPNSEIKEGSVFIAQIEKCQRIQLKSNDNTTKITGKVIFDVSAKTELRLYPNPAKDKINLTVEHSSIKNVSVTGLDGRVLVERTENNNEGNYSLDITALPSGIYIVNVTTGQGKMLTQKLIVE